MLKKYRGEIPFWLLKSKKNTIYLCSSNKNLENYYDTLKDFYNGKLLKITKSNEEFELEKLNYEVISFLNKEKTDGNQEFIILISLDMFIEDYDDGENKISFKLGDKVNLSSFISRLEDLGFEKTYLIEKRMQYSLRGDILDIFSKNGDTPVRIEFFGEEIDRITNFNLETQISIDKIENFNMYINNNKEDRSSFLDIVSKFDKSWNLYFENRELLLYKLEENILINNYEEESEEIVRKRFLEIDKKGKEIELERFSESELNSFENYDEVKKLSTTHKITLYTEEEKRFKDIFKANNIKIERYPHFEGYRSGKKIFLTDRELKGIRVRREKVKDKKLKYTNVSQIKENDYIIHENYGVGLFLGIENIEDRDYMKIRYADEDKLFVPIENISKIEKYINVDGTTPEIFNLGTRGFKRKKQKLKEDMMIFAKEIIEIQAKRNSGNGFKFSKDTIWQEEFEEGFPFQETPSQMKAIEDVKNDMESSKVMDRLICGDVGYGKTEVAIRAAFKAVMDGKQVAILVPTTVLAEQHFDRFSERFKNYPATIEVLSRINSKKNQNEILESLKKGTVDIIIGTHRLLSEDIKFKDLGLLIIDEEQKFGVKSKEKLKTKKENIDVLTLTATPIPRTLNMAFMGIRDLSVIDTPPEGRQAVETIFIEENSEEIKKAIMQEVSREGQVFYIYNSVKSIKNKAENLRNILYKYVNVDYIHGQMNPTDIKRKIKDFINMEIDVLVSTTIIENGIDIENANTMIIEGTEKLGLSQIYQLRGRIGRGDRKSYCYLISKEYKGKKATAREETIKILGNSGGMQLSMEDMKIRGVGEILGDKQHGAIETFGYNLYLKMLNEEIERIKGKVIKRLDELDIRLNFPKYIPDDYIEKNEKIVIYKRALDLKEVSEVEELRAEVEDRFGTIPKEAEGFFRFLTIKLRCEELGIVELVERKKRYYIKFEEDNINIEKIIEMIEDKKAEYLKREQTLIYKGEICEFFDKYGEGESNERV